MQQQSRERAQAIACDTAARRLWDYVDARLPHTPRAELDAHLATCAECASHVAFARAMRRALTGAPDAALPADGLAALRAQIRRALADERVETPPPDGPSA